MLVFRFFKLTANVRLCAVAELETQTYQNTTNYEQRTEQRKRTPTTIKYSGC